MLAFMSYQTRERGVAGRVAGKLEELGVECFMAHEHIEVSSQWRTEILRRIRAADVFVPVLSERYLKSAYCMQESGIAAFRKMPVIPLSIDGTIPPGFLGHVQSIKIDFEQPLIDDVAPGIAKLDVNLVIDKLTERLGNAPSYRAAEGSFALLKPYLSKASKTQIVGVLKVSAENNQICHATACARSYLPPLLKTHGRYMPRRLRKQLSETVKSYAPSR